MRDKLLNLIRLNPKAIEGNYDWTVILKLAEEQSVVGVALKGAQKLPSEKWPPRKMLLQWIGCCNAIEQQNEKVNAVLSSIIKDWERHGLHPIVIKGQIIAQEYEDPLTRQSGDIDVFFAESDWEGIYAWLKDNHLDYSRSAAEKHIEVTYKNVSLEFHYHINTFSSEQVMQYWQDEIENKAFERQRIVNLNGTKICTLGITDTLVHLMVHAHHHLLTEGVGLRQLMDMCLFVHNHFDELDLSLLHQHIVGIGHKKAFNVYMALINKYLGLPKEQIPFELDLQDYVYADKIMDEVWRGGNFGHKNNLKGVNPGLLHSLNTARLVIAHSMKFYRLAPAESRAYWWHKIFWRMKRKTN